jgi:hypothetical protein
VFGVTRPLDERVREYRDRCPHADVATIAGALCESPARVAAVLSEDDVVTADDDAVRSSPRWTAYADADWSDPNADVYPPELHEREQWMGHSAKIPFAPWADRDHPEAGQDEDARWKWGLSENYRDGDTVAMAEVDPRLDGRAFLQQTDDPFAYVDGDDVRDPETGEVHPAFVAILEHLGLTYADVSTSGTGVHAIYRGELPDGVKEASWQLDEDPWRGNDELPSIELYARKRVCVMTGDHVPGTPVNVRPWSDEAVGVLVEANDEVAARQRERVDDELDANRAGKRRDDIDASTCRDDHDLDDHDPNATSSDQTTTDIRDLFHALERIDARDVAGDTIVSSWNDSASTSDGVRAFAPTWGRNANGTANIVDDQIWQDTGDEGGYGGPVVMALIDAGEMSHRQASPRAATGALWFRGVERLRDLGYDIPRLVDDSDPADDGSESSPSLLNDAVEQGHDDIEGRPTVATPLGQLEHLDHDDRRRAAQKRGLDWPTTREARDRLFATISEVMRQRDVRITDAPTALGKSFTVATTSWSSPQYEDVTGGKLVVHLQETRDARDESIQDAHEAGVDYFVLRARHEACPVAAGDHDPTPDDVDSSGVEITIHGQPASEWLATQCDGKGIPFSVAHQHLADHNDQDVELPCCQGESTTFDEVAGDFDDGEPAQCPAIRQWDELRAIRDSAERNLDVVFATHNFLHVPSLRMRTNVVVDEQPDFAQDLTKDRVARAVTAYLQAIDAPVTNWESFVGLARYDGWGDDAGAEREALQDALQMTPDREWYLDNDDAHTLAPALARAVFNAEPRGNARLVGKTPFEPPRLDAQVSEDDAWNREWVTVVMTEDNGLETVRCSPDVSQARSLVGLDAHPARPLWQVNVHPNIQPTKVLGPDERQLWRRYERGLRVVQVGDATRPLSGDRALEWLGEDKLRTLLEELRDQYGADLRTAITTAQVEDRVHQLLADIDAPKPSTMHYGEEKSRNDFATERVGLINGCVDPGDDYVVDLLAELDLDAAPETAVNGEGAEYRAPGREFVGDDADTAAAILASVRENHTAQAAGRYARNPDDLDSHATVFVRTDAMPTGFADVEVPGVEWVYSDLQEAIVEELRTSTSTRTARGIADAVGCSKEHVRSTLRRLAAMDTVQAFEGEGAHGATLYADNGLPNSGVVDLATTNDPIQDSNTWSLAIRDPAALVPPGGRSDHDGESGDESPSSTWEWRVDPNDGGDTPTDEAG